MIDSTSPCPTRQRDHQLKRKKTHEDNPGKKHSTALDKLKMLYEKSKVEDPLTQLSRQATDLLAIK